jgi:Reverse transcriptase (RNA-dependent DNA polymerase)
LVHDIIFGVNIGYTGKRSVTITSPNFTYSEAEDQAVSQDMANEVRLARIAGPFDTPPFSHYRCSPIKTTPKKGSTVKYRIIHHLSYPHGRSVNTSTADWPCPLARFSQAVDIVRRLGRGCYMAKVDVQAAYRAIPIRPADWPMLGMYWQGRYYFHRTLPFGLRSSCHLWERYATAAEWIIVNVFDVPDIIHYVDDTFLAAEQKDECKSRLGRTKQARAELGIPEAHDKTEGPTTCITFLGIQIDSREMTVSLDLARLTAIRLLLHEWEARTTCSLRQLQSTIGTLSWAAQVVRHGRTFLQHMRDTATLHQNTRRPNDTAAILITEDIGDDLRWWTHYLGQWNGVSLLWEEEWMDRTSILQPHTDACVDGYAGVCGREWFHGQWTKEQQQLAQDASMSRDSMPWKELFAIVAAAATWGRLWSRRRVLFFTDCMPVVQALAKGASRTRRIMQLIRLLHFYAAHHHFVYRVEHIPGVDNVVADELSRVFDVSQLSIQCRSSIDPSPITPVLPLTPF